VTIFDTLRNNDPSEPYFSMTMADYKNNSISRN